MMKAKDIMSTDIVYIQPHESIFEASKIMKDNDIGFLPILENDYIHGVITDRDIILRAISNNALYATVKECATTSPLYMAKEDTDIHDIINLMSNNKIRRVLIVNENQELKGIISLKDIILSLNFEDNIKGIFTDSCVNPYLNIDTTINL